MKNCTSIEQSKEYSFNIPSEVYNTLETDADKLLWKTETERAFEAGWDAAIDKACEFIQTNVREYHKSGVFHVAEFIKDLRKAMKE